MCTCFVIRGHCPAQVSHSRGNKNMSSEKGSPQLEFLALPSLYDLEQLDVIIGMQSCPSCQACQNENLKFLKKIE